MALYDSYTKLMLHADKLPIVDECGNNIKNSGMTLDNSIKKIWY